LAGIAEKGLEKLNAGKFSGEVAVAGSGKTAGAELVNFGV
jgi:hypothetical protein